MLNVIKHNWHTLSNVNELGGGFVFNKTVSTSILGITCREPPSSRSRLVSIQFLQNVDTLIITCCPNGTHNIASAFLEGHGYLFVVIM